MKVLSEVRPTYNVLTLPPKIGPFFELGIGL